MGRWGAIVLGVVLSLAASIGLGMVVGFDVLFPGASQLTSYFIESDETFGGIDRDAGMAALPPFTPPDDLGSPTRVEVLRLLKSREFASLTEALEAKRARVATDIRHEAEWSRLIWGFDTADAAVTPLLDEWVTASPDAVTPYLARGVHAYSLAYEERGTKAASDTTAEQFAGMARHLETAQADATTALARDFGEVVAYELLIDIARTNGTQGECGALARAGLAKAPASFRIRWALAICRLPRWGGSTRAVEAVWEKARPFVADHADLASLGGVLAWDQGRSARGGDAMTLLNQAIAAGPNAAYFLERSRLHYRDERLQEALDDANLGLILAPEHPQLLEYQFTALANLGKVDEAAAVLAVLAEVDASNSRLAGWQADMERMMGARAGVAASGNSFEATLQADGQLARRGDWDGIIQRWTAYLSSNSNDARAYLERAGAYRQKGDMALAQADIVKSCELGNAQACGIASQMGWR